MSIAKQEANQFNWLHLDMKGAIPEVSHIEQWLQYFADCGFNGVVLEYEDRIPWQTWPDTFRPGFDLHTWRHLWGLCRDLGLEVVPLAQMQGHLEWLLKHEQYRPMRENDQITEVCPLHPDVRPKMLAWIDEVVELHPDLRYIHLGADETWSLATCPRCQAVAKRSDEGGMKVYLDHVSALCEHALDRGVTPLIWADMFWREQRFDLVHHLPEQTILVDWQYDGPGPWPSTARLAAAGHRVWGGSGARIAYHMSQTQAPLQPRIENVLGWHALREQGAVSGLIHTNWGRSSSLRPIYGLWEGWLPAYMAAGNPQQWPVHPLDELLPILDRGLDTSNISRIMDCVAELERTRLDHPLHERAVAWWRLALQHRRLVFRVQDASSHFRTIERNSTHVGMPTNMFARFEHHHQQTREEIDHWQASARTYWGEQGILDTDTEEFLDSRAGMLLGQITRDEADEIKLREQSG